MRILIVLVLHIVISQCSSSALSADTSTPSGSQVRSENDEPPTENLMPELRVTGVSVIHLLEDDEKKDDPSLLQISKHPGSSSQKMDCTKITMQTFQVLLQNPDTVEPEDYSCGLLNLISHVEKSHGKIRSLESSLNSATSSIKALETTLHTEIAKNQLLVKELNETLNKEMERAIKAENVIARRVLSEKSRVDTLQKNFTEVLDSALEQVKEFDLTLKDLETHPGVITNVQKESGVVAGGTQSGFANAEEIQTMGTKLTAIQTFMQELSSRISTIEAGSEDNASTGMTQIFKTYASLANDIEKETERATGEEVSLKSLITTEIASMTKQIQSLQERIAEEKNRAQVIENRRTADLFEEINRAKSEEGRLGVKLKEEISKAVSAFKRLEQHVDQQTNSTKMVEEDLKTLTEQETKRAIEAEARLTEHLNFERNRAQSVENLLKTHLESEIGRATAVESDLKKLNAEEKERAKNAEQELKAAIDVETYRAKGVEISISAQVTSESERAKEEQVKLVEHMNANMTRLLTEVIKEFTRAQNVEKELEDKILHEAHRAQAAEQALLTNINSELTRASDKEEELDQRIKQHDNTLKSLHTLNAKIESEEARARNAENALEGQIQVEVARARGSEDRIINLLQEESHRAKTVESNFTTTGSDLLRHTRELELEVRKTVMAEVARAVDAENYLKLQINSEMERATKAESLLSHYQLTNSSDIANRLQQVTQAVETENMRLENLGIQISRNLTGDILTLAELFDDKLDDLERNENMRFKKVEDEMKKCCSGSSWRWRNTKPKSSSGSTAETVINTIMQAFTSSIDNNKAADDEFVVEKDAKAEETSIKRQSDKTTTASSKTNSNMSNISLQKNDTVVITSQRAVESKQDAEKQPAKLRSNLRKKPVRSSRTAGDANNKVAPAGVSVQSAKSKVSNTFG